MEVQRSVEYAEAAQAELQRILPQLNDVMDAEKDIDRRLQSTRNAYRSVMKKAAVLLS